MNNIIQSPSGHAIHAVLHTSAKYLWKLNPIAIGFLLPLLLLAACNSKPKDDGTTPPSLFTPPKSWEANPKGGYQVNMITGLPVEPLTTRDGKKIITGIPIPAVGKRMNPDSIAKPKPVIVSASPKQFIAQNNIYPIPENLKRIPVDESKLKKHNAANSKQGFVLTTPAGDTIPTGVPIAAKGKTAKASYPKVKPALPLRIKDNVLYDMQYLNVDQGLQSPLVTSMLEDKDGHLWFGSFGNGVSRYDGKSFVNYTGTHGAMPNATSILQDRKGHLWFGTPGTGARRYDGKTFVRYDRPEGFASNSVSDILEDKAGNIWFATNRGVSKFEPSKDDSTGTFINYTTNEGLSNNDVRAMVEDRSGNLWFGTNGGGVCKFDGKSFIHFTKTEGLANDTVRCIMKDKAGDLWMGTPGGVSKFDGKSFVQFTTAEGLSNNDVRTILEDSRGHLWFGTNGGGVSEYDGKNFVHITEAEGLSHNSVNAILEDKFGYIWIGTAAGGVTRFNPKSFLRFTKADGLSDNFTLGALKDSRGHLWFGTNSGGVNQYDGKSFIHFTRAEGFSGNNNRIIIEDRRGLLWFGSNDRGVIRFEPPMGGRAGTLVQFTRAEGLSSNSVNSILEDSRGHLWFGINRGGLTRYEPSKEGQSGTFTHFTTVGGRNNNISSILEDKSGNLWFGTNNGVTKYIPSKDGQSGTFVHFTAAEGLSGNDVNSILEDKNGHLWFASDNGAIKYEPSKDGHSGTFTHFTTDQGLSTNNDLRFIMEDKSGNLWFSSRGGVTKYDGKTFFNFTTAEGLSVNQVVSSLEDKDGNLWFTTTGGGVSRMEKNAYSSSQHPLVVRLRQLYINEAVPDYRNPSDSIIQKIKFDRVQPFENYPVHPRIPSGQNHLSLQYSAIDWSAPNKIRYSFRMLGLDNKWSNPSAETIADYRNLPNGKFIFQVRAIGESGEWSKSFDYPFTILPPWWKTWWAYILYALLFLGALRIFSKWRERKLLQEKEQLQHKVEERTSELKKSLEDLKSTQSQLIQSEKMASLGELTAGIAHEIQNPLNFVNNFSEVNKELLVEMKDEIKKGNIDEVNALADDIIANEEKINHHGKRAGSIVSGMLQHSRSSSGKKEPTDINALADEYLRLSYHGLRAKDKSFNATMKTDFDESIGNINIIPQDIGRVVLNLINNAFYAAATPPPKGGISESERRDNPTVWVSTKKVGDKIFISVKDNGQGIPQKIIDKIFQPFFTTKPTGQGTGLGLSLSYDIVKAHGGELKVETKEGEGSEFIIQMPLV